MLKKNNSQKRFNTAGARIPMSRKLPSDFFKPNVSCENKESIHVFPFSKVDIQNSSNNYKSIVCTRNPLEFTFRRSNSEEHYSLHEKVSSRKYLWPKKQKENIKESMKLPPIINFSLLRQTNESTKKFATKLLKKPSKKISQQLRISQQQKQNAEI